MLQRGASNAYSWWWASHIRTKQSKWLEHNLQDMEERVTIILKLIEEDGDSFAELYFKKKPELIHFVQESYRAYRALAERYDHISTELQNANTTIAAVFPDQVQFAMDDDDDEYSMKPGDVESLMANKPHLQASSITGDTLAEVEEDIVLMLSNESQTISKIEEKFRMNIDELLNENLDFWSRFSSAFQEVSKFETEVKDLHEEISKLEEQKTQIQEGSSTAAKSAVTSNVRPLYKHMREVEKELNSWIGRSLLLKDELKNRFSSLCDIQEEITKALKESASDDELRFTSYQSAKFQGEILNMKQENNKVSEELEAGLDHVKALQIEVERSLAKLSEEWKLWGPKYNRSGQLRYSNRTRVPLRSFIFSGKSKKQKPSIFDCVHPALHRK